MAYAIKYLFKFESSNGTTREIRVLQDGYTGEVIQRPLGRAPILKKQQNGPVHGTSLEFYAECHVDREFIEFYTSDPKAYRVDLYAGATLLWQGYITPELYSEPDIAPPYDVRVVATDGVGELKLYDYAAQGTVTLRALLSGLLARTGLGTDVYLISSLKAGSRGAGALLDMTINLDYMAGKTCYKTLTYILDTLHATITWWKGAWILTRETNVTFTNGKVRYFNTAGNSALLADSVQTLGSLRANPAWPVGQLSTVIDPAKNRVAVQAPWHVVTCLQNSDMGSDSDWTKAKNARYETDGYVLPVNVGTGTDETAVISQATSMAGLRVPMSISVKATGAMSEITARVIGSMLGVLLTYKVGNVTYHLVKGEDGSPTWQQGEEIGTYIPLRGARIDFQQQLVTWNVSRIEAEELSIDNIPPFLQGASFPAGTLTVYILGYCVKVYGATLDVILPKGYQDILRIDNGARGEGSEVEVAIGRETADNAYYADFLQGLLLDSDNLITSFSDANFPAGMDYLAFIARDYALSVALPRAKVTGTVYLESGIAAPPLVFTKGALNYWLQTWSWNLKEDELEIDALTLPSASLTVESETILESNGSTVSSADSAGSSGPSSSMGVGTNYFELATDPTLVQLRQAYSYLGPRKGLIFEANEEADANADFEKVALPGGSYALHSRLPFYSDSFISAGGISSGGGASAGNATLVAQTYGGTLSATGIEGINFYSKERVDQLLLTAGTVQTVAGVSPTSGDIPVASLKSALGLGAAAEYGIGSVAFRNTGLVTGGSVYSAINEAVSSVLKMQGTTTTPLSDGSTTNPVVIDGSSYTAKKGDVVLYDGKEYLWAGSAWEQLGDEASWALKTTSISAGTGLEGGGTLASNRTISINSTYQTYISNGNTAYGWGNHANAGYLLSATAASTYATITALNGVSGRVTTLEGRTNWDTYFGIDEDGNIYVKKDGDTARNFYSFGAVSAGGLSDGGGSGGIDPEAMWQLLGAPTNEKINASHIPDMASTYGYLKSADAVANVALNGYYLRVTKNGANTDLIIPYAATARYVVGDNNAASPQYALLQSGGGRQDASPEGDTWLFCDTLGGASFPWGIRHNQGNNTIGFIGAGTERILLNMQTGAITSVSFVKSGGTSAQFLKADGSVDSSAYITGINSSMVTTALGYTPANSSSLANYVTLGTEQTITSRKIYHHTAIFNGPGNIGFAEGIRCNLSASSDPWSSIVLGGAYDSVGGTDEGVWTLCTNNKNFYFGHNGSSNATYGLSWTSSGALNLKTSSLTSNGSTIWTAANDGANSGLDADLLDGQHGSYYAAASSLANYVTLASSQTITGVKTFQSSVSGGWSYLRLDNKSVVWDLATINSTAGMLIDVNTFEIRDDGGASGLAVRHGTSSYGRVVIVSSSGESSLGFWSTADNPAPGYPIWVCGYTADSNKTFGWFNRNSSSDFGWRMLLGRDGHLAIGGAPYSSNYVLNAAGSGNFSASLNVGTSLTVGQTIRAGNGYSIAVGTPGAAGSSAYANYISAGPGYSANSGRYGVKILVCDQSDAQTGLGQDVVSPTGWSKGYNLCVIGGNSPYADYGYISFTTHIANSNSYRYLGGFRDNAGAVTFQVIGNIVATGAITAGSASDARLKTNIKSLSAETAMHIVMALNPVTFTWNSTATKLYDQYKGDDLGFIAQEVEPYLPQAVGTIFEKYMRLDQTKVIAPLVAVAQDHETRIRQLERENTELKRRLNMN